MTMRSESRGVGAPGAKVKHAVDWPECAGSLGRALPGGCIHPAVDEWARRGIPGCWLLCVSGGADSVAMALFLWAHCPQQRERMRIAHFNHNLRGEEARSDAAFVRALALGLGVPVREAAAAWPDAAAPSEADLREERWAFLRSLGEAEPVAGYFVGHHADDVAETLLMRLARGSSSSGLGAPRPVQVQRGAASRLRPLLGIRKRELEAALREAGAPWCEDASNTSLRHTRNRLRHRVLPELEAALPQDLVEGLACSREWLDDEDEALRVWLADLCPDLERLDRLPRAPFKGRPRALWRRALAVWLQARGMGTVCGRRARESILHAWEAGRPWRCSAGDAFIACRETGLSIERPAPECRWPAVAVPPEVTVFLPGGGVFRWRMERVEESLRADILGGGPDPARVAWIALRTDECAPAHVLVRQWQPGDRFRPMGHPGTAKLQDLFTDRKIPAAERKRLPVVCRSDGSIIWIPGFPPAESRKVSPDTALALRLTYENV